MLCVWLALKSKSIIKIKIYHSNKIEIKDRTFSLSPENKSVDIN